MWLYICDCVDDDCCGDELSGQTFGQAQAVALTFPIVDIVELVGHKLTSSLKEPALTDPRRKEYHTFESIDVSWCGNGRNGSRIQALLSINKSEES